MHSVSAPDGGRTRRVLDQPHFADQVPPASDPQDMLAGLVQHFLGDHDRAFRHHVERILEFAFMAEDGTRGIGTELGVFRHLPQLVFFQALKGDLQYGNLFLVIHGIH